MTLEWVDFEREILSFDCKISISIIPATIVFLNITIGVSCYIVSHIAYSSEKLVTNPVNGHDKSSLSINTIAKLFGDAALSKMYKTIF